MKTRLYSYILVIAMAFLTSGDRYLVTPTGLYLVNSSIAEPPEENNYTNVLAHYDAGQISSSPGVGDHIAQWDDLSGNGNHLTQATYANQPMLSGHCNGEPTVRFGDNRYLVVPDMFDGLTALSVMIVARGDKDPARAASRSGLWHITGDTSENRNTHWPQTDGTLYDSFGVTARTQVGNLEAPLDQWNAYMVTVGGGNATFYMDNTQVAQTAKTYGINDTYLFLGRIADGVYYFHGDIAEMVLFDGVPSETIRNYWFNLLDAKYDLPNNVDEPEQRIHIRSSGDVTDYRNHIIDVIWSGDGFPAGTLTSRTDNGDDAGNVSTNLADTDAITIEITKGAVTKTIDGFIWTPTVSNNELVIFLEGHQGIGGSNGFSLFEQLTDEGYTVVALEMPDDGNLSAHNSYPAPTDSVNYLRFFVEGAIRVINDIGGDFDAVKLCGFSGGGFATPVVAAIDTRVSTSIGMHGSLPLYMTLAGRDWEQFLPDLDPAITYIDLYTLSGAGSGRKHIQILNEIDQYFNLTAYNTGDAYATDLTTRVSELGGEYSLQWINQSGHEIHQDTIDIVIAEFGS